MAKKIFPGNWVAELSSFQTQCVESVPGRVYYQKLGYALVGTTGATEFDITIPSPDMRGDDKPRANITGLTLPSGANVYHVGMRIPDMRKDRAVGSASSGLVGTNTDTLAIKDAAASAAATISTTVVSTPTVAVASTTVAPTAVQKGIVTPAILAGAETLKLFVRNAAGNGAGSNLTSTQAGGTPVIAVVCYYLDDVTPGLDAVNTPFVTEAGGS
jgi:hypothetical protein